MHLLPSHENRTSHSFLYPQRYQRLVHSTHLTSVEQMNKDPSQKPPCIFQTNYSIWRDIGAITLCLGVVDKCPQILLSEHHLNDLSCSFAYKITRQLHLDDPSVPAT